VKKLFVDTGALLAQRNPGDEHHRHALAAFARLASSAALLYSSEHVLDETLTLLARRESYSYAAEAGEDLLGSRALKWLSASPGDWRTALSLMRKYADQAVSFTDCISFALMKREAIKYVFGFDRHFRAAGFRLWREP
jgi:predicted nucleic acid-binding protein